MSRSAMLGLARGSMIVALCLGTLAGCDKPAQPAGADSKEAAAAAPMVGYDLRRLRPREDESLTKMFDRMFEQARDEGKRVVVIFSADWCEPCQLLDLELGNTHPPEMIGDVRVLELKEEDWNGVARMNEFNDLRARWEPVLNTYPLVVMLDERGAKREEMKEAKDRLEEAGLEPTLPMWFEATRSSS